MFNKIKKLKKEKRGYVSIVVLILMMVLIAATYLFASTIITELAIARNNKGASVAFSLAEAGVQEAIYRVQYDTSVGGAREKFFDSTGGMTSFSHDPALISTGSYNVTIQNIARASAVVTSTGLYRIGTLRTAKREIKVGIAQADAPPPYPYDGGIYATGSGAGSSIADIDFWYAPVTIYNGGILANRDINFKFGAVVNFEKSVEAGRRVVNQSSTVNCNCLMVDDDDPLTPQCNTNPGCTPVENAAIKDIPQIDFEYYKAQAKTQNQYFTTQKEFNDLIPKGSSHTFSGVVFVDGSLDIDDSRNITVNGVIAASGSITISKGQLALNRPDGNPAGVLTTRDFVVGTKGSFGGTGLVYAGDRAEIDSSTSFPLDLTGAIIARRTWVTGYRVVTIHFDSDVVNITLGHPTETPIIEINHWEEEY